MEEKKIDKLNNLLRYVKENNQFYREFYKDIDLPVADIKELPVLIRKSIRSNTNKIISDGYNKKDLKYDRTNGTTEGKPLEIYKLKTEWIALDFDLWNIRRKINKEAAKKYVFYYFNGNDFSEPYRYYESGNRITLQIAMRKQKEEDFVNDLNMINKNGIKWIIAPPSIIFSLCCISLKYGVKVDLDVVESISEYMPLFYKKFFEEVLGGKVYIHYSCHEIWGMGFTNEDDQIEIMDQCILNSEKDERFDRDYEKCIATNLRIKSMPFINYELSDLIKIEGNTVKTFGFRWTEEAKLEDFNIHCSFFDNIFLKYDKLDLRPLENYQIVYKKNMIIIYLISQDETLRRDVEDYVRLKIQQVYGQKVIVECKLASRFFVDIISGKMRGIIKYEDVNWDGWEFHLINDIAEKYIHNMIAKG